MVSSPTKLNRHPAYPELRLVAVMHNDKLSYAETFDEALRGLYDPDAGPEKQNAEIVSQFTSAQDEGEAEAPAVAPQKMPQEMNQLIQSANSAFDTYFELLGEKRFGEASEELDRLGRVLEQMSRRQEAE